MKTHLDTILDHVFISRVVSLIYSTHHKVFPKFNILEQQAEQQAEQATTTELFFCGSLLGCYSSSCIG